MIKFSPETCESLGRYVYALLDNRRRKDDVRRLFYVGKGKDQRCFQHARAEVKWRKSSGEPNPKLNLIREIRKETATSPQIEIIRHGLSDDAARELEAILIKTLRTDPSRRRSDNDRDTACNRTGGRGARAFCLSINDIEGIYSRPLRERDLKSRDLLVNLNGGTDLVAFPDICARDLPRRVLRYWRIAPKKADAVDYILGVYRQIVRVVFKVRKNRQGSAVYRRFDCGPMRNGLRNMKTGFTGERCLVKEQLWSNRRIFNGGGEILTKFARQQGWKLVGQRKQI